MGWTVLISLMAAAVVIFAVAISSGSRMRADLLSHKAPSGEVVASAGGRKGQPSFSKGWGQWLSQVTTQVEAAEDVSKGLSPSKVAQLNGLLYKDLVSPPEPPFVAHL